jgi:hypothetical protein
MLQKKGKRVTKGSGICGRKGIKALKQAIRRFWKVFIKGQLNPMETSTQKRDWTGILYSVEHNPSNTQFLRFSALLRRNFLPSPLL